MSSVSFSTASLQRPSPRDMLQSALATQISAGTIKAADKDALSGALDTIDASMRSSRPTGSRGSRPSLEQMQSKVESLIDGQVQTGALTDEQASELKQLFSDTLAKGQGGARGAEGPGGSGGPHHHGPRPDGDAPAAATTATTSSDSDIGKVLQDILKKLSELTASYGSSGASSSTGSAASVLLDTTV